MLGALLGFTKVFTIRSSATFPCNMHYVHAGFYAGAQASRFQTVCCLRCVIPKHWSLCVSFGVSWSDLVFTMSIRYLSSNPYKKHAKPKKHPRSGKSPFEDIDDPNYGIQPTLSEAREPAPETPPPAVVKGLAKDLRFKNAQRFKQHAASQPIAPSSGSPGSEA